VETKKRGIYRHIVGSDGVPRMWYAIGKTMVGCVVWDVNAKAWVASCLLVKSKFGRKKYHTKDAALLKLSDECDLHYEEYIEPEKAKQLKFL